MSNQSEASLVAVASSLPTAEAAACRLCAGVLPLTPKPIFVAGSGARLLIISQAPGRRAHDTGIPWNDSSGVRLRDWLGLAPEQFYDPALVAILPMGFCYPGKGATGDLPPRPECAPLWHPRLLPLLPNIRLTLLIGRYAQAAYLAPHCPPTLTEAVQRHAGFMPRFFPLPHPSPLNRRWLARNPWFADDVVPVLRTRVREALGPQEL